MTTYPELRSTTTATIASAGNLSGAVNLSELVPMAIIMPAAWTAAALTFQASADNSTYNDVYTSGGGEYTVQAAASRFIVLDLTDFVGMRYLKVRSGTSGTPVAQAAQRVLTLVCRPV